MEETGEDGARLQGRALQGLRNKRRRFLRNIRRKTDEGVTRARKEMPAAARAAPSASAAVMRVRPRLAGARRYQPSLSVTVALRDFVDLDEEEAGLVGSDGDRVGGRGGRRCPGLERVRAGR